MKLGVIIICHNSEQKIKKDLIFNSLNDMKNLKICMVNNDSKDNTYELLKMIKEQCANISLVNVKKQKSDTAAVRAGARYMYNHFNLRHLGYVLNFNNFEMNSLMEIICKNQKAILNYNIRELNKKETKLTLFQSLFSVTEYLKKLKIISPI